jgi:hypothetical protein
VASRLSRIALRSEEPREAISLDPRGKAVADVEGVAASPDGETIALAAGGTHELLLLRLPLPFVAFGGPGDHIDAALLKDSRRFRRIALGGRPVAVAFSHGGARALRNRPSPAVARRSSTTDAARSISGTRATPATSTVIRTARPSTRSTTARTAP